MKRGNRDLKSTRLYNVKVFPVSHVDEISKVIAEGWEKALQTADKVWFRQPRWVP